MNIKIIDSLFSHAKYSTDFQESKHITWDRKPISQEDKMVFYTDNNLSNVNHAVENKIAWLVESKLITNNSYRWIRDHHHLFDNVLTHDKELLDISDKFKLAIVGGCWIKPEDQMVYDKTKMVSIIASTKNMTYGHKLRHDAVNEVYGMNVYGRGYNPVDYKLKALKDYRYSVVIENAKYDYYFTEKLVDCFATGTIPIYWGCPSIGDLFDVSGMIIVDSLDDIKDAVASVSIGQYEGMLEYIESNFNKCKEYLIAEDYIYENFIRGIIK